MESGTGTDPNKAMQKFEKLVRKLDAEQIARIPLERVPASLDPAWIARFPAPKATALLELGRRRDTPGALDQARATRDARIRAGVKWLNQPATMAVWLRELRNLIEATESAHSAWLAHQDPASLKARAVNREQGDTTDITLGGGDQDMEFAGLLHLRRRIDASLARHAATVSKYTRVLKRLEAFRRRGELPADAGADVGRGFARMGELQDALSRIRLLRLHLAHHEMSKVLEQVERQADRKRRLQANIDQIQVQMRDSRRLLRRLTRRQDPQESLYLQEIVERMQTEKAGLVVDIADASLDRWLNAVVDATLDAHCQSLARSKTAAARALFVALVKYRQRTRVEQGDKNVAEADRLERAGQELQRLLRRSFDSIRPDLLLELRSQQARFRSQLMLLQSEIIDDLLAPTSPRAQIST